MYAIKTVLNPDNITTIYIKPFYDIISSKISASKVNIEGYYLHIN